MIDVQIYNLSDRHISADIYINRAFDSASKRHLLEIGPLCMPRLQKELYSKATPFELYALA